MPIKRISPPDGTDKYVDKMQSNLKSKIIAIMKYLGEVSEKYARERHGYRDQTGNLTSSMGYAVLDDGREVDLSGFDVLLDGRDGSMAGKAFLTDIISEHRDGIVLIVVAGMDYAAAVESKGYDVLSGSEMNAKKLAPALLKKLQTKMR